MASTPPLRVSYVAMPPSRVPRRRGEEPAVSPGRLSDANIAIKPSNEGKSLVTSIGRTT
jgi:hypothetical protein